MIPIQTRIREMALAKPAALAPIASTDSAEVTFSLSGSSFECSPLSNPSAPPPTPTSSLYDINPRKSSFSGEYGMGAACAFPSWPNRAQLSGGTPCDSFVNNAYLSDEDLLWMPENSCMEEDSKAQDTELAASMTMEQQLQRMRAIAAAEEEDRVRFLARVQAHARATHALRQTKTVATERVTVAPTPKSARKQRRVVPNKRRAHSSSKVPSA